MFMQTARTVGARGLSLLCNMRHALRPQPWLAVLRAVYRPIVSNSQRSRKADEAGKNHQAPAERL